jgi:ABC-type spermidine/putrescine transport system permease subunit II
MTARQALRWAVSGLGWAALVFLLSPILYACWVSFTPVDLLVPPTGDWSLRWYRAFFGDRRWTAALGNSLVVAGLSVTGSLLTGLPLAYALARFHFRGRSLVGRGVLLPLAVPPVVLGVGLLPELYALGLWGSPLALALAHTLLGLPLVCVLARTALEAAGSDLESAARGLGATPWRAAYRVTLPLIRPAVTAGAVLVLILSLNEFVLSLFLATPETETLPRVIWPSMRYSVSPLVAAASGVLMAVTSLGAALAVGLLPRLGTCPHGRR